MAGKSIISFFDDDGSSDEELLCYLQKPKCENSLDGRKCIPSVMQNKNKTNSNEKFTNTVTSTQRESGNDNESVRTCEIKDGVRKRAEFRNKAILDLIEGELENIPTIKELNKSIKCNHQLQIDYSNNRDKVVTQSEAALQHGNEPLKCAQDDIIVDEQNNQEQVINDRLSSEHQEKSTRELSDKAEGSNDVEKCQARVISNRFYLISEKDWLALCAKIPGSVNWKYSDGRNSETMVTGEYDSSIQAYSSPVETTGNLNDMHAQNVISASNNHDIIKAVNHVSIGLSPAKLPVVHLDEYQNPEASCFQKGKKKHAGKNNSEDPRIISEEVNEVNILNKNRDSTTSNSQCEEIEIIYVSMSDGVAKYSRHLTSNVAGVNDQNEKSWSSTNAEIEKVMEGTPDKSAQSAESANPDLTNTVDETVDRCIETKYPTNMRCMQQDANTEDYTKICQGMLMENIAENTHMLRPHAELLGQYVRINNKLTRVYNLGDKEQNNSTKSENISVDNKQSFEQMLESENENVQQEAQFIAVPLHDFYDDDSVYSDAEEGNIQNTENDLLDTDAEVAFIVHTDEELVSKIQEDNLKATKVSESACHDSNDDCESPIVFKVSKSGELIPYKESPIKTQDKIGDDIILHNTKSGGVDELKRGALKSIWKNFSPFVKHHVNVARKSTVVEEKNGDHEQKAGNIEKQSINEAFTENLSNEIPKLIERCSIKMQTNKNNDKIFIKKTGKTPLNLTMKDDSNEKKKIQDDSNILNLSVQRDCDITSLKIEEDHDLNIRSACSPGAMHANKTFDLPKGYFPSMPRENMVEECLGTDDNKSDGSCSLNLSDYDTSKKTHDNFHEVIKQIYLKAMEKKGFLSENDIQEILGWIQYSDTGKFTGVITKSAKPLRNVTTETISTDGHVKNIREKKKIIGSETTLKKLSEGIKATLVNETRNFEGMETQDISTQDGECNENIKGNDEISKCKGMETQDISTQEGECNENIKGNDKNDKSFVIAKNIKKGQAKSIPRLSKVKTKQKEDDTLSKLQGMQLSDNISEVLHCIVDKKKVAYRRNMSQVTKPKKSTLKGTGRKALEWQNVLESETTHTKLTERIKSTLVNETRNFEGMETQDISTQDGECNENIKGNNEITKCKGMETQDISTHEGECNENIKGKDKNDKSFVIAKNIKKGQAKSIPRLSKVKAKQKEDDARSLQLSESISEVLHCLVKQKNKSNGRNVSQVKKPSKKSISKGTKNKLIAASKAKSKQMLQDKRKINVELGTNVIDIAQTFEKSRSVSLKNRKRTNKTAKAGNGIFAESSKVKIEGSLHPVKGILRGTEKIKEVCTECAAVVQYIQDPLAKEVLSSSKKKKVTIDEIATKLQNQLGVAKNIQNKEDSLDSEIKHCSSGNALNEMHEQFSIENAASKHGKTSRRKQEPVVTRHLIKTSVQEILDIKTGIRTRANSESKLIKEISRYGICEDRGEKETVKLLSQDVISLSTCQYAVRQECDMNDINSNNGQCNSVKPCNSRKNINKYTLHRGKKVKLDKDSSLVKGKDIPKKIRERKDKNSKINVNKDEIDKPLSKIMNYSENKKKDDSKYCTEKRKQDNVKKKSATSRKKNVDVTEMNGNYKAVNTSELSTEIMTCNINQNVFGSVSVSEASATSSAFSVILNDTSSNNDSAMICEKENLERANAMLNIDEPDNNIKVSKIKSKNIAHEIEPKDHKSKVSEAISTDMTKRSEKSTTTRKRKSTYASNKGNANISKSAKKKKSKITNEYATTKAYESVEDFSGNKIDEKKPTVVIRKKRSDELSTSHPTTHKHRKSRSKLLKKKLENDSWKELIISDAFKSDFEQILNSQRKPVNVQKILRDVLKTKGKDKKTKLNANQEKKVDKKQNQLMSADCDDAWLSDSGYSGTFPGLSVSGFKEISLRSGALSNVQILEKSKLRSSPVATQNNNIVRNNIESHVSIGINRNYLELYDSPKKMETVKSCLGDTSSGGGMVDILPSCGHVTSPVERLKVFEQDCFKNADFTYLNQISKYLRTNKTVRFLAKEIAIYAKDKQLWNLSIA